MSVNFALIVVQICIDYVATLDKKHIYTKCHVDIGSRSFLDV